MTLNFSTEQKIFSYHQVCKASGLPTLLIQDIQKEEPKSLREIARLQSVTGGQ